MVGDEAERRRPEAALREAEAARGAEAVQRADAERQLIRSKWFGLVASAEAARDAHPMLAPLLAREAVRTGAGPQSKARLRRSLIASRERRALRGHDGAITSGAYSSDGRAVVTASVDGTARLWSSGDEDPVVLGGHATSVSRAAGAVATRAGVVGHAPATEISRRHAGGGSTGAGLAIPSVRYDAPIRGTTRGGARAGRMRRDLAS